MEKNMKVGIFICCCFGFGFFISGVLSEFTTDYNIGRALGFLVGFCGVFFVMFLDAILEKHKKNKKLKSEMNNNY